MLLLALFYAAYAFGLIFFVCELGQRSEDAFKEIEYSINALEWNLFPLEIQRLLSIILTMSQKPVELQFFGSFSANHETLKKVS